MTEGESPRTLVTQVQLDYQLTQYLRDGLLNGMTLENAVTFGLEWSMTALKLRKMVRFGCYLK